MNSAVDNVNHPEHYIKGSFKLSVEPIWITEQLDFCAGNAVKYICRAPFKGKEQEDLEKALFYLRRLNGVLKIKPNIPEYILESFAVDYPIIYLILKGAIRDAETQLINYLKNIE